MLSRRSFALLLPALILLSLITVACEKVPLLAPTGSTITLTATETALSANGRTDIIAQVLESAGTPPHSGTHVTFSTTLGRIEPSEVSTDLNGRVIATFIAGGANGTATIRALSGGAVTPTDGSLKILVGTAAVGKVAMEANPTSIPASGGTSTVFAVVLDINGNSLVGAPVSFSTTAGTLSSGLGTTNANGVASVVLTTSQTATVTASVGATAPATGTGTGTGTGTPAPSATGPQSGSIIVTVLPAPSLTITPPAAGVVKGVPATFTFTIPAATATSVAIRDVTVNWGDGAVDSLGSFTGAQSAQHTFRNDGTFRVTGTVTDAAGGTSTATSTIGVVNPGRPGINIAVTPGYTLPPNAFFTFTITVTPAANIAVRSVTIDYGDSQRDELGGSLTGAKQHRYSSARPYLVTVIVEDSANQTSTATVTVFVE